ncbi:hypothetical protein [Rhizorhabdus wittichii]|uniref:hypothetical protein n=1 Tax=Rhizorhabdus wittichii TaxID=160791 RepID=UPI000314206D|nr:hypothetical protein [Rhizorhabdus wittichii]
MSDGSEAAGTRSKLGQFFDRLEKVYLGAVRVLALVFATIIVIYAAWLALSGTYKVSKDVELVKEKPAIVSAEDVANVKIPTAEDRAKVEAEKADPLAAERRYYKDFAKRYHGLFKQRFEAYRQPGDEPVPAEAFEKGALGTEARLARIGEGDLDFAKDKTQLEALLKAMTDAAVLPATVERLTKYKGAKKTEVTRQIRSTRTETYCAEYYYYIDGCMRYGSREVPVTRSETTLELPKGVVSYIELFGLYHENFLKLLSEREAKSASDAAEERESILADNAAGGIQLMTAVKFIGAFLTVMFLFLLVAVERHQRRIATMLDDKKA